MNFISFIAETFNYIILVLYGLLHNFLQLNFTVFSTIIYNIHQLKEFVSITCSKLCKASACGYQDFIIFLYEVIDLIRFVIDLISNFWAKTCFNVNHVLSVFGDCALLIYSYIIDFSYFVHYCIAQVGENAVYLMHLVFTSLLLILQAGPNLLIILSETLFWSLCYVLYSIKYYSTAFIKDVFYIYSKSGNAIYSIPVKAYCGALIFYIIFCKREYIYDGLVMYYRQSLFLFKHVWLLICLILSVCLKPVLIASSFLSSKLRYVFSAANAEETDVFYDASPHGFSIQRQPQRSTKQNLFVKCLKGIINLFDRYPFVSRRRVEQQIEQLQKELSAEREKHLCIICYDKPRNMILYPCRHMCVCEDCCVTLQRADHACPLCRHNILDVYHVYT